jgi:hypothetical protein
LLGQQPDALGIGFQGQWWGGNKEEDIIYVSFPAMMIFAHLLGKAKYSLCPGGY